MTLWEKIKSFFGVLDLNRDGRITAEDAEVAIAAAEQKVEAVKTETKRRVKRVKEELKDVGVAAKEVASQTGDVIKAVKGEKRTGRKAGGKNQKK